MARRGEEKTIKVSADVADLQRAFENVERAYADVAQASKDYARAVEASAKAVTDDEKAMAKEVEKTTKAVLQATKQRASAYKSQAAAIKTQVDAIKQKTDAVGKDTKEQESNTKALGGAKTALMAGAAAVLGLATKYADLTKKIAESKTASEEQKESAKAMMKSMEEMGVAAASATVEFTNFIAAVLNLGDAENAIGNLNKSMKDLQLGFRTLAIMQKEGVDVDEAVRRMKIEDEMAKKQARNDANWAARQKEHEQLYKEIMAERKRVDDQVASNHADRLKAIEEGERKREENAKRRAEAARRRAEEQRKLDEQDRKLQEAADIELILAEAEAERMNAEEEALRVREQSNAAVAMGIQLAREKADEDKKEAKRLEEEAELRRAVTKAALEGAAAVGEAALRAADQDVAATVLSSAAKVGFYTAESIAAFGAANPVSGIAFAAAAAQHAIVAGGALAGGVGGGGGGGGAKSPSSAPQKMISSAPIVPMSEARETSMVVNVNTLSYVSAEDARRIAQAEARETRATVGGRPR